MQIERYIIHIDSNFFSTGLSLCRCFVTMTGNDEDDSDEIWRKNAGGGS